MVRSIFRCAGVVLAALALASCDRHEPAPPRSLTQQPAPPPSIAQAPPTAPDTATMGAGPLPMNCGIAKLPVDMLAKINAARAAARSCGGRRLGPAPPLQWDTSLSGAASSHSTDMARRNYFEHASPEGRDVSQRASSSGYGWKGIGENIAAGDRSVDEVVQSWLQSPDHCSNIMEPKFSDVAVACAEQQGTQYGTYWTMVLGRKR
jgi:uncharacterized protein YkwD